MVRVAVYDANVLYPSTLRDLLIRLAQAGVVRARWSEQILDEVFRNLHANRPDLSAERLARTRQLMSEAVREPLVRGYEPLVDNLVLPDPGDRHVLAAAIRAGANVIVSSNVRHFPASNLAPYNVTARRPDDFVVELLNPFREEVLIAVRQIADSWRKPPGTSDDVIASLERSGLSQSAAALRTATGER